jgi:hypothetical protein
MVESRSLFLQQYVAQILTLTANINRDPKRSTPFEIHDFMPR